jgi:hypothetical protein
LLRRRRPERRRRWRQAVRHRVDRPGDYTHRCTAASKT